MRATINVVLFGILLLAGCFLYLTPYTYTKLGGMPVRVHRLTGHRSVPPS
jgi:hypothetical protein